MLRTLLVGIGLIVGLSPALAEWSWRIADEPATAYVLAFPILLLIAGRSVPATEPDLRGGLWWILAAAAVQVLAFGGGIDRGARLALPLGVIGFLRFTGTASLAPACLALFLVPVPSVIASLAPLETIWRVFAEGLLGPVGPALRLDAWDSGVRLVAMFAGLGWYADARAGASWSGALRRASQLAMLGLPVQLGAVILAVGITRLGAPGAARLFLTHGVWLLCAGGTVAAIELGRRQEVAEHVV